MSYDRSKHHANTTVCLRYRSCFRDRIVVCPTDAPVHGQRETPLRSREVTGQFNPDSGPPSPNMSCFSSDHHWPFPRIPLEKMNTDQTFWRLVDRLFRSRLQYCIFVKSTVTGRCCRVGTADWALRRMLTGSELADVSGKFSPVSS